MLFFCVCAENIINKGTEKAKNTHHTYTYKKELHIITSKWNTRYKMCCACPFEIHAYARPFGFSFKKKWNKTRKKPLYIESGIHFFPCLPLFPLLRNMIWIVRRSKDFFFSGWVCRKTTKNRSICFAFMNNGQLTNMRNKNIRFIRGKSETNQNFFLYVYEECVQKKNGKNAVKKGTRK